MGRVLAFALAWALLAGQAFAAPVEFNLSVTPTLQNASYSAGQALGGLQSILMGDSQTGSGILTQVSAESKGGSTVGLVFYIWSQKPGNTTCTDKANFVVSTADNAFLLSAPFIITPAVVVSGQDTHTYAQQSNMTGNFSVVSPGSTLYVCALANATVTPATTSDLRFNFQGFWDNASQ